jgi:hypothetical protein
VTSTHFNFEELTDAVERHLRISGLDKVVLDVSRFTPSQAAQMADHVSRLPAADRTRIMIFEH